MVTARYRWKSEGKERRQRQTGYGKGKHGGGFGKYDKNNEHSKNNGHGKGSEKGKGKKGKGKRQGKDEKPAHNSNFQGYCRSCGQWGHKASECWQRNVQAVVEFPRLSATSEAQSATTAPVATKTTPSLQEIHDEHEPGWVFGVMGGSVSSITTGTGDLWDELVLDSGSVPTACPYAWCSDSVNDGDKVHLHRRVLEGTKRLEQWNVRMEQCRLSCACYFFRDMRLKTTATPSKLLATNARLQEVPGLCQHLLDRWHLVTSSW